jgi:predicted HicB family RNase H-like nuclease
MVRAPSPAEGDAPAYRVSVTRADGSNGDWLAEVEGAPECSARGQTAEEAVARSMSTLTARDGSGGEAKAEASRRSGRILVRMPVTLHDELANAASAEGVSLNQLITGILASAVAWRRNGDAAAALGGAGTADGSAASPRLTRIALAVNLGAVVVAAIAAIVLIVIAWQNGW